MMYSELQKREPRKDNSKVTLWFPSELRFVMDSYAKPYSTTGRHGILCVKPKQDDVLIAFRSIPQRGQPTCKPIECELTQKRPLP
jgi:hypothetical protein